MFTWSFSFLIDCKRRRFSIQLFVLCLLPQNFTNGWTEFGDSFFIGTLVLPVWFRFGFITNNVNHEKIICFKFALIMYTANGQTTQYNYCLKSVFLLKNINILTNKDICSQLVKKKWLTLHFIANTNWYLWAVRASL